MSIQPRIHFTCPRCHAQHDRGYLNGIDLFRCLRCGYVGYGHDADPDKDRMLHEKRSTTTHTVATEVSSDEAPAAAAATPAAQTLEEALAENAKLREDNLKLGKFAVRVRHHALDLRLPDTLQNSLLLAGILAEADRLVSLNREALVALDDDEELRRLRTTRATHDAEIDKQKAELREARRKAEAAIAEATGLGQQARDRLASVRAKLQALYDRAREWTLHPHATAQAVKDILDEAKDTGAIAPFFVVDSDTRHGDEAVDYVLKGGQPGTEDYYLSSVFMGGAVMDWRSTSCQSEAFRCDGVTARHLARLFHARIVRLRPRAAQAATGS